MEDLLLGTSDWLAELTGKGKAESGELALRI